MRNLARNICVGHGEFEIPAGVPHLMKFLADTVMLEWWDGPFSAEYYPPYRRLVEESLGKPKEKP